MITLADQWSDPAPIEGDAQARARKYSIAGPSVKPKTPITTALCGNQRQRGIGHNDTVIMQTSQVHYKNQRQHGGAYVVIVMIMITATLWRIQRQHDQSNWRQFSLTTGVNAQYRQLARISATQHQLLDPAILHHCRQQNLHRQHQESGGRVGISNGGRNHSGSAPGTAWHGWRCSKAQNRQGLAIAISGADDKEQKTSPSLD